MHLYQIGGEFDALSALLEEQTGAGDAELDTVAQWFSELEGALTDKLTRCVAWAASEEALAAAAMVESKRLAALAKRRTAGVERLKQMVRAIFEAQQLKRIDTPLGAVRLVGNGGALPVIIADSVDVSALPEACVRVTYTAIKDELRDRLVAGQTFDGITLGERGSRLELGT